MENRHAYRRRKATDTTVRRGSEYYFVLFVEYFLLQQLQYRTEWVLASNISSK